MLAPPENYKLSVQYTLNKKIQIGKKGTCRYCGEHEGKVSFGKIAHALPELIGNKFLFSLDECDECNESFDKNLENNLANFLGITRTTTSVQGKKGVPKFKSDSGERVEKIGKNLIIIQHQDSALVTINENHHSLALRAKKKTYTPIQVYKCFVKMALAITPTTELKNYKQCIDWVRYNKTPSKYNKTAIKIVRTFIPGPKPYEYIWIALFKRIGDKKKNPNYTCAVGFNNLIFYFAIPFCSKDKFLNYTKMEALSVPMAILPRQTGRPVSEDIDLTESKPVHVDDIAHMYTANDWKKVNAHELPEEVMKRIRQLGLLLPGEHTDD